MANPRKEFLSTHAQLRLRMKPPADASASFETGEYLLLVTPESKTAPSECKYPEQTISTFLEEHNKVASEKKSEASPYADVLKELLALRQNKKLDLSQKRLTVLLDLCYELAIEAINNLEAESEDFMLAYAELASDLSYACPQAYKLSQAMMPFKSQAQFAFMALTRTLAKCNQLNTLDALARDFPNRLSRLEKYNEREVVILIQELWQINNLVSTSDPVEFQELQEEYLELRTELNGRQWKKIKKGFALLGTVSVGAIICTAAGGLPALVWIGGFIATKVTAGGMVAVSGRYMGSGSKKLLKTNRGTHQVLSLLPNFIPEDKSVNLDLNDSIVTSQPVPGLANIPGFAWSLICLPLENQTLESKDEAEIINETTMVWQAKQTYQSDTELDPQAIFSDIVRNGLIDGEKVTEENCQQALDALINKASAYNKETEQDIIRKWIYRHGGQEGVYYLVPLLIFHGHFQAEIQGSYTIGANHLSQPQWEVENEKIYCSYDVVVKSMLVTDKNQKISFITLGPDALINLSDEPPESKKDDLDLLLLFRIKIRLDLMAQDNSEEKMVLPRIVCLEVASPTDDLLPSHALTKNGHLRTLNGQFIPGSPSSTSSQVSPYSESSSSTPRFGGILVDHSPHFKDMRIASASSVASTNSESPSFLATHSFLSSPSTSAAPVSLLSKFEPSLEELSISPEAEPPTP